METKSPFLLAAMLLFAPWVSADTVDIAADHPQNYVVQKGDTLWDISGRFLEKPWRWPEIWDRNPQIANPHLIYPGDMISLVYRDGMPMLKVTRRGMRPHGARPLVKLSPTVRSEPHDRAIPSIPINAIGQFLSGALMVTDEQLSNAPYIVDTGRGRLITATNDNVYVRGLDADGPRRMAIYRRGSAYRNPGSDEILGYEAIDVGEAVVEEFGDPATLRVTSSVREVLSGDRLLPVEKASTQSAFVPREPSIDVNGSIVSVVDGVSQIGQHHVVVLNVGADQGLEVGDVLAVYQKGEVIEDRYGKRDQFPYDQRSEKGFPDGLDDDIEHFVDGIKRAFTHNKGEEVTMPDRRAGVLMVVRTFGPVSYGLVMESDRSIHVYDTVKNP